MKCYVWITSKDIPQRCGRDLTYHVVLAKSECGVPPEQVCDSVVWVLRQEAGKRVIHAKMHVSAVEILLEGPQVGCVVLQGDIDRSFYYEPETGDRGTWAFDYEAGLASLSEDHLSEVSNETAQALQRHVADAVGLRFNPPTLPNFDLAPDTLGSIDTIVPTLIRCLKRKVSVGDLHKHARHPYGWSVYESIAFFRLLELGYDDLTATAAVEEYASRRMEEFRTKQAPAIDLAFREIVPSAVVARSLMATAPSATDWITALAKADMAEKRHQEILRNTSAFLIQLGHRPLQSASVDMALPMRGGALNLVEVKSSTRDNFFNQATHGAMQLLHYRFGIEQDHRSVGKLALLIEDCEEGAIIDYVETFLSSLDIVLLLYRKAFEWPNRVPKILKLLK